MVRRLHDRFRNDPRKAMINREETPFSREVIMAFTPKALGLAALFCALWLAGSPSALAETKKPREHFSGLLTPHPQSLRAPR
jgi:hypothetical protein